MVRKVVFLLALWGVMQPAAAEIITIDPDDYPNFPATDISTAFDGVTLSTNAAARFMLPIGQRVPITTRSPVNSGFPSALIGSCSAAQGQFSGRASISQPILSRC